MKNNFIFLSKYLLSILFLIVAFAGSSIMVNAAADFQIPDNPTPLPNPLLNPVPTAMPVPVSAWRPPLYPVPWALTQNDHFYFIRPIAADEVNWPQNSYGYGGTNFGPNLPHTGVDIVAPLGTPVIAAGSGRVIWAGNGLFRGFSDPNDPYGLAVAIAHDFGYENEQLFTVYAHLSRVLVTRGQEVKAGDLIGLVGSTGLSTAEHLHFEVRKGSNHYLNTFNPLLWTSPPQGWGMLVGRVSTTYNNSIYDQQILLIRSDNPSERRWAKSYGSLLNINVDPFYKENFILNDLPAGKYLIEVPYVGYYFHMEIQIFPGAITFFNFRGFQGLNFSQPFLDIPSFMPFYEPPEDSINP